MTVVGYFTIRVRLHGQWALGRKCLFVEVGHGFLVVPPGSWALRWLAPRIVFGAIVASTVLLGC
jgi:hypothetical protein